MNLEMAVDLLDILDFVLVDLQALDFDNVENRQDEVFEEGEEREVTGDAVDSLGHSHFVHRNHPR
jgi:hypothetical protein